MRSVPIPDGVAQRLRGSTTVIGVEDVARGMDVTPAEYLVLPSALYQGRPVFMALLELDDMERAHVAAGGRFWLALDGAEVPWSVLPTGSELDR